MHRVHRQMQPGAFFLVDLDLAVTRFSGRKAPLFTPRGAVPNMPAAVELDAYSDEVSSAGFWPGGQGVDYPAFYSYASPAPDGFSMASVHGNLVARIWLLVALATACVAPAWADQLRAYGLELEGFEYPFTTERFSFPSQNQTVSMTFMDVASRTGARWYCC